MEKGIVRQLARWLDVSPVTGKPPAVTLRTALLDVLIKVRAPTTPSLRLSKSWLTLTQPSYPALTRPACAIKTKKQMLPAFETDKLDEILQETKIGKAVRRLQLWSGETDANRAKAARLISTADAARAPVRDTTHAFG